MQFLYDPEAGAASLRIGGENHKYLFKVRRFRVGASLSLRNLLDDNLYRYRIEEIGKREALLALEDQKAAAVKPRKYLHLLWCMVDPKTIEKSLPALNQTGVSKITLLYCDRSQRNFRPDFRRLEKILINSCQQCGRSDLMKLEIMPSLDMLLESGLAFGVLDFGGETAWGELSAVLVGCEGGFSENERKKLHAYPKIAFDTDFILKSETAAQNIAAKLLI